MNYETEITTLKKLYYAKLKEYEKNKKSIKARDANGLEEYNIDLWFHNEIYKLKSKYNVN